MKFHQFYFELFHQFYFTLFNYHELSSKSLQKVMLQQDCKKQLKDCIELYLMSDTVCEQICNLSIKI